MVDRRTTVTLDANNAPYDRAVMASAAKTRAFSRDVDKAGNQIDTFSGRARVLVDVLGAIGPAAAPVLGVATVGLAGMASQLGFAAVAGGVLVGSMQGVKEALEAVNKAGLEPTAANVEAAKVALEGIDPEAARFVRHLHDMIPALKQVRDAGAEELFPHLTDSLDDLDVILPKIEGIFSAVAGAVGEIGESSAESFASDRWAPFYDFIANEAPSALADLARITGDLTHGAAEMWMAFDPGGDAFSDWLVGIADGFDKWASSAEGTKDIEAFLAYARQNGPYVADFFGSLVDALAQIVQAAAPLGGPVLTALTAVVDVIGAIADSDIGTPLLMAASAMSALSLATKAFGPLARSSFGTAQIASVKGFGSALVTVTTAQERATTAAGALTKRQEALRGGLASLGKGTALLGGLAIASTGAGDSLGLTNTASLALMGSLGGPFGVALGGAAGAFLDAKSAAEGFRTTVTELNDAVLSGSIEAINAQLEVTRQKLNSLSLFDKATGMGDDLREQIESAQLALERLQGQSLDPNAMGIAGLLGQPLQLGDEFDVATQAATDFKNSMLALNDALAGRSSMREYEAAIDAVTDAVTKNGQTLDITTQKGRDNQAALDAIAGTSIKVGESLKGMDRVRFMARAREDFIDAAVKLGKTRGAARDLADDLGLLNTKKAEPKADLDDKPFKNKARGVDALMNAMDGGHTKPTADLNKKPFDAAVQNAWRALYGVDNFTAKPRAILDTSQAMSSANALENRLNNIADETVRVSTIYTSSGGGGTVGRKARGGLIRGPGTTTSDSIPALLSDKEYVVKAAAVEKYGVAMFDGYNAMHFASGGHAGGKGGGFPTGWGKDKKPETDKELERWKKVQERLLEAAEKQREAAQDSYDAAKQLEDAAREQRDAFKESVANSFNHDIYGNGLAGAMLQMDADANDSASMQSTLEQLVALGLDGDAFTSLAASGDLTTATQLLAGGATSVGMFENSMAQRNVAQNNLGAFAQQEAYPVQTLNALEMTTRNAAATIARFDQRITGIEDRIEAAVERGSERGTSKRDSEKNRETKQRGRNGK